MTQQFVKYSPDVERADPNFEFSLRTVMRGAAPPANDTPEKARARFHQFLHDLVTGIHRTFAPASAPDVYRPALVAELTERPYEFDLQVQLCVDLIRMPVEDVTAEWLESYSPFVTVARLLLPRPDLSSLMRHQLNQQERREPRNLAELFGISARKNEPLC